MASKPKRVSIYRGDEVRPRLKDYKSFGQPVPCGTDVKGVFFDGYPQITKQEGSKPEYSVNVEKDIMVPMRDGVRLATDIYRPDVDGKRFPAILSYFFWGKDAQEVTRWLPEQEYWDTPFWDGSLETGAIDYFVERGYVRVIPEPRNFGKSEGTSHPTTEDTYDVIEWIASQPWCDGNVGMIGACGYAGMQTDIAANNPPPSLKAIVPFEAIIGTQEHFHGIFDCMKMNILTARHGNDHLMPNRHGFAPLPIFSLPPEELEAKVQEALNHPDIKYNARFYAIMKYPKVMPMVFEELLESFHPRPITHHMEQRIPDYSNIKTPIYISTPWNELLYTWQTFEIWEKIDSPNRKLALWPSKAPGRPFVAYSDEILRFHDYWLKGIDTGIMEEPPVKIWVMGANGWCYADDWPLPETEWTKFYLHSWGRLRTEPFTHTGLDGYDEPDGFLQMPPTHTNTIQKLRYMTDPLPEDTLVIGPVALYLYASIDQDDTNWIVILKDVGPDVSVRTAREGECEVPNNLPEKELSRGWLKASHRALDSVRSKPWKPWHPLTREANKPVVPGEINEYAIEILATANLFKKGHRICLDITSLDLPTGTAGATNVEYIPYHICSRKTTVHKIYHNEKYPSHLLLPIVPNLREIED